MSTAGPRSPAPRASGRARRDGGEGSGVLVVRNTIANAVGSSAAVVTTLVLTPFMIDRLGATGYGVWILATTLTFSAGYLSLTDLGVQQAAVRFIAEARGRGDDEDVSRTYSSVFALFLAISLLVAPVLVAVAPLLARAFGIDPPLRDDAQLAFLLAGVSLVFDLPSMAYRALLEGAQRFIAIRVVDVLRTLALAVAIAALLVLDRGVVALTVALLATAALSFAAFAAVAARSEPAARLHPRLVARDHVRRLLSFGGGLFVLRIVSVVYRQMDRVIIGAVLGVALVTEYEIANKIQAAATVVVSITASALLPAAAFFHVDRAKLRDLFLRGTAYTLALALPVTVAAILYAHPLVVGWVGEEWARAVDITRLFLVWLVLSAFTTVGWTIVVALGRLRPLVLLNVAWVTLNLALSLALVFPLGVAGVVWGTVLSSAALTVGYLRLFLRELGVPLSEWLRRVVAPNVPGLVAQLAVGLPLLAVGPRGPDLLWAAGAGTATAAVSVATFLYAGLGRDERRSLLATLRQAVAPGRAPRPPAANEV